MKGRNISLAIIGALAFLTACHPAKQAATGSGSASIVGKHWKLIELNGQTVKPADASGKEPYLILNASEKRINGSGGCNSFFGSYAVQGSNGITFSPIGATKMACQNGVMQVESQLFQAFEKTNTYALSNDTLLLSNADRSSLAKFVISNR